MKEAKKRILFENYYTCEQIKKLKELLWKSYKQGVWHQSFDLKSKEDISDEEVNEELVFGKQKEWHYFVEDFKTFVASRNLILTGTVGRWDGNHDGGARINTFQDIEMLWKDCDYIQVYDQNGHLHIKCSHHDGTNIFKLKKLTQKGVDLFDQHNRWEDSWSQRKLFETLSQNPYSALPNYAHNVYGLKK